MSERDRLQQEAEELRAKIDASIADENGLRYAIRVLESKLLSVRNNTYMLQSLRGPVIRKIYDLDAAVSKKEYP